MTRQGTVNVLTRGGAYASLLAQKLDGRLSSADSLRTAAQVHLTVILSKDEAFRDLVTFAFVASHLSYVAGRHAAVVV